MRRPQLAPVALLAVAALSACGGGATQVATAAPTGTQVRVSGSGTAMPLVRKLAQEYTRAHPDVRFDFTPGTNSGGAISGVKAGTFDLAVVNRTLKPAEADGSVSYVAIARDAVAFAVGPGAQVDDVTTAQVRRIYGGKVVDWRQLGATAGPMVVLDRDPDESARKLFLLPVLDGRPIGARTTELMKASEMADALAGTPGAFGYTAVGYLKAAGVVGVRPLSLDGTAPTADNVTAGTYPWALTLALVHGSDDPKALREFVAFAAGSSASATREASGYAPPPG